MDLERIQKLIAQTGLASRREAEQWIKQDRVRVNNLPARLGDKASKDDQISVDGRVLLFNKTRKIRIIMLNKPQGIISTRYDPGKRKTVFQLLPKLESGRWVNIGRLDINTTGLLLFTNEGEIANQLMHPRANLEREYLCRVFGSVSEHDIDRLLCGIKIDSDKSAARFKSLVFVSGKGKNQWFKVILSEGRYREVRRLWEAVNCKVNRLSRIRYGPINLPEQLAVGDCLELSTAEIKLLTKTQVNAIS